MLLIKTKRLPKYYAKRAAYKLQTNRDKEFVKRESKLSNTLNSRVQLSCGCVGSSFKVV